MVEHEGGAAFAHGREALVRSAGADDGDAVRAGDLHGRETDPAGGAVHEHDVAGPRAGAMEQCAIGGRVRDAHGRALSEGNRRRQLVHVVQVADRALGVSPAVMADDVFRGRAVDEHAIAGGDGRDVRAHGFDVAGRVRTRDERQRRFARVRTAADVHVNGIHADRSKTNDHLIGSRLRIRDFLELQHLGAAMLANDDSSHGAMLS